MQLIDKAHKIVGHFRDQHTGEYIHQWYWWPKLVKDCREFCRSCKMCAHTKVPTTKPRGEIHSLLILTKLWDSIGMDFIGPFPELKGHNYL
ncbi:Pro-Pol polyprotein [Leucoagaricus sp. SymC.cos]|nr:Pro-Pol polyprotein [Leucoagaricus sp. SymC.cos]